MLADAGTVFAPLLVCSEPDTKVFTRRPLQLGVAAIWSVILQDPLAGIAPPVSVTCELPATALSDPRQLVLAPPETTMPLGKVSVNGSLIVAIVLLGFVRVMLTVDIPPELITIGLNVFPTLGGMPAEVETVSVATVPTVLVPLVVCSTPTPRVLVNWPSPLPVTFTVIWHWLLAGIEPPVRVRVELPFTAVRTPPQLLVPPPTSTIPVGRWSTSGAVNGVATVAWLIR